MSSYRHRKRSRSHEKSHHSSTHKSPKRSKSVATKTTEHNEDVLQQFLQSVTELKADLSVCNSRIPALKAPSDGSVFPNNEHDDDILSVSAGNDLDQYDPANKENMAIKPQEMTIQSPDMAIGPPTTVTSTEFDVHEEDSQSAQAGNELNSLSMCDPDNTNLSWAPSEVFTSLLEKNFCRKLSYDQICKFLEQQSFPAAEALVVPTLDQNVAQHIASKNKKFVQE